MSVGFESTCLRVWRGRSSKWRGGERGREREGGEAPRHVLYAWRGMRSYCSYDVVRTASWSVVPFMIVGCTAPFCLQRGGEVHRH
jgi:hypothetical protein